MSETIPDIRRFHIINGESRPVAEDIEDILDMFEAILGDENFDFVETTTTDGLQRVSCRVLVPSDNHMTIAYRIHAEEKNDPLLAVTYMFGKEYFLGGKRMQGDYTAFSKCHDGTTVYADASYASPWQDESPVTRTFNDMSQMMAILDAREARAA